jgi:2-keto-3-deoxy-L-rhamnonate aldolase RhmA
MTPRLSISNPYREKKHEPEESGLTMKNAVKAKLRAGEAVFGFRMDFVSPYIVEILGKTGFDFVYFDCEHGPMTEESCDEMIRAAEGVGITPLVRTPSIESGAILRYLDSGAMGVIIPHCHNQAVAENAVKAVKYPPAGDRGMGGRSFVLSGKSVQDYVREANEESLIIVMIEDPEAVDNLEEILAIDQIDVLFVGRLDLSVSLGIPGQLDHPRINEIINEVISRARPAGKAVGVGAVDDRKPEHIREFLARGAQFFSLNTTSILSGAARESLHKIKGVWVPQA